MRVILISLLVLPLFILGQDEPDWAVDAIWYQIFPERFSNGDPANDPTLESLVGTWPWDRQIEWEISPWESDWYEFQPWEIANQQPFNYQFQIRRYGGDIQGIIDKLDYLQDLGINAIYLNPVFQSPSSHKYGAESYRHIDRFFGPDPEGDLMITKQEDPLDPATWQWTAADRLFLKLIDEVHQRNMHIIIDGVFNHIGLTHWAFQDVIANGEDSPYYLWFNIKDSGGEDYSHFNEFQTLPAFFVPEGQEAIEYTGYVADLPAFRQDQYGPVEPVREHLKNIVERWGDPNSDGDPSDGLDGWRLDVADRISLDFWRLFSGWVKAINPEAYLTGEVWWDDYWNNIHYNAAPWLEGDAFDAVMNYRFGDAMLKFFVDQEQQISADQLDSLLGAIRNDYRPESNLILQNLLDSHDTERLGSSLVNPDRWIDHANNLQYNRDFDIRKPMAAEWQIAKAIAAVQFTYVGAPYIYYGGEAGMWGADDPDCRKPMIWDEYNYADEVTHPCDRLADCDFTRPVDTVEFNQEIFDTYKTLAEIRQRYQAPRRGDYETIYTNSKLGIFVYQRSFEDEKILVVANGSKKSVKLNKAVFPGGKRNWKLIWGPKGYKSINEKSVKIFVNK